jgi:hypothetical protein
MKTISHIFVVLVGAVVLCGCDRSVSVPLPYDTVLAQVSAAISKPDNGAVSGWHKHKLANTPTPSSHGALTMSRGWTRSSKTRYEKMTDEATVVFTPDGETATVIQISVRSYNAFALIGKGERNRGGEKQLARQLSALLTTKETFEQNE